MFSSMFLFCFAIMFRFYYMYYYVEFRYVFLYISVGFLFVCFVTAPSLLFHCAIPRICQLSWLLMQLYSVLSLLSKQFFFNVSTTSIAQTEKTSWTNTGKLKRMLWPLDSASSEYGPVRPLPPVPWCEFSAQQDCVGRRIAAPPRHLPA